MPLSAPDARSPTLTRSIVCTAYRRGDWGWDIEGHLLDTRQHELIAMGGQPIHAGDHVHDMWVRLTVSDDLVIARIEASMDAAPWTVCPGALGSIDRLIGIGIGRGFTNAVTERIGRTQGCTHIREMLGRMANVAMQAAAAASVTVSTEAENADAARSSAARALAGSCYSFDRAREVIHRLAPGIFDGPIDPSENPVQREVRLRRATQPFIGAPLTPSRVED